MDDSTFLQTNNTQQLFINREQSHQGLHYRPPPPPHGDGDMFPDGDSRRERWSEGRMQPQTHVQTRGEVIQPRASISVPPSPPQLRRGSDKTNCVWVSAGSTNSEGVIPVSRSPGACLLSAPAFLHTSPEQPISSYICKSLHLCVIYEAAQGHVTCKLRSVIIVKVVFTSIVREAFQQRGFFVKRATTL